MPVTTRRSFRSKCVGYGSSGGVVVVGGGSGGGGGGVGGGGGRAAKFSKSPKSAVYDRICTTGLCMQDVRHFQRVWSVE